MIRWKDALGECHEFPGDVMTANQIRSEDRPVRKA